ncbi:MAG: sulfatase-like hydrolase/transferase [Verrucomicrobiales bacterium]
MPRFADLCRSAGLLCAAAFSLAAEADAAPPPNIVLLIADDLGYGELGCQGNPQIPTPHIDSLAADGVRFTSGYVTAAYCSASRAGLMTGKFQARFGYEFNPIGAQNDEPEAGLPVSQRTIAQHLRGAGYATALIGKWHLGGAPKFHPLRRGFGEFFGFLHEGHFYLPPPYRGATTLLRRKALPGGASGRWISPGGDLILGDHMGHDEPPYDANNPILRGGQPVEESEYLTDALTREATDFIGRSAAAKRPFFLCLAYNAVHSPMQGADEYMARFAGIDDIQRRIFAAMLANLDDSVGAVLEAVRQGGVAGDTLVVFLSDNGGPTKELTSSNAPLRGGKGTLYEGGVRIPFLLRWPAALPAGDKARTFGAPVISTDLFATFAAAAAGVPVPENLDGIDLLPLLKGDAEPPERPFFWRTGTKAALRFGDAKIVGDLARPEPLRWELFDLASDAEEQQNLAASQTDRLNQMVARWEAMNAEMIEPVWKPGLRK